MLDFRVEVGDQVLDDHFKSAPRNATYRSKTVQNEIIDIVGDLVKKESL